jgi:hypothetical protein
MSQAAVSAAILVLSSCVAAAQAADPVSSSITRNQYDLASNAIAFLKAEIESSHFFLLGELHGEKEIPALVRDLWPLMWRAGYRHIAAEVSPLMANRLESGLESAGQFSLWTQAEASFVTSLGSRKSVLWGCDMEELRPHLLIRSLADGNALHQDVQSAAKLVQSGYTRQQAAELLRLIQPGRGIRDRVIGGRSLLQSILETLAIDIERLDSNQRLRASIHREEVMKEIFRQRWAESGRSKVFLRFGRNHLHRGYDRRGVSTLGNFVAELGIANGLRTFNMAAFAGGGKVYLANQLLDADERSDDPAFTYLASMAQYPATVFDLRPLRQALHRIPEDDRSKAEASLVYWADSYDAILFYKEVTPIRLSPR